MDIFKAVVESFNEIQIIKNKSILITMIDSIIATNTNYTDELKEIRTNIHLNCISQSDLLQKITSLNDLIHLNKLYEFKKNISFLFPPCQEQQRESLIEYFKKGNNTIVSMQDQVYIIKDLTYVLININGADYEKITKDSKIQIIGLGKDNNIYTIVFQFMKDIEKYKNSESLAIQEIINYLKSNYPYAVNIQVYDQMKYTQLLNPYTQKQYLDILKYHDYVVSTENGNLYIADRNVNNSIPFNKFNDFVEQLKPLLDNPEIDLTTIVKPGFLKIFGIMLTSLGYSYRSNYIFIKSNPNTPGFIEQKYDPKTKVLSYPWNRSTFDNISSITAKYEISKVKYWNGIDKIDFHINKIINDKPITIKLFINGKFRDCQTGQSKLLDLTEVCFGTDYQKGYVPYITETPEQYLEPYYKLFFDSNQKSTWIPVKHNKTYTFVDDRIVPLN